MSSDLEVKWGTVSLAGHSCDRIGFRHRPGKANEGDELGLACIAARASHDFFGRTPSALTLFGNSSIPSARIPGNRLLATDRRLKLSGWGASGCDGASPHYCFSYTAVALIFWPLALVPREVTVRVLPSAE